MLRREFLCLAVGGALANKPASVLVHEHVLVDFVGADQIRPGRYDREEVFRIARPKLEEVRRLGCRRVLECTPNFLGRDPALLARLSDAAGIEIWSNTGLYGAVDHKFVPAFARSETAEQLARRWIGETRAAWRPRFIKIGVNRGPLDEIDRKLVRAAGITPRETGLTIASHTGDGAAAVEQVEMVMAEKVSPAKFVWVHAQNERDHGLHERVARAGAWVEFDGIGPKTGEFHLECVRFLAAKGLLNRTLISQDAGWYHVGEPGGGEFRGYTYLYSDFLPRLKTEEVAMLMWENPRAAFGA
ncbi:MAG: aryldialkylphosphatase [Acidobacteria bacterium]|nr:MAG: aryldialkylphosphatase [Acidobacteriota bacterium]